MILNINKDTPVKQLTSIEEKYYFLIGIILGSVELEIIEQDSHFLKATASFLEGNQDSMSEMKLLNAIQQYQSKPYEPPF